jgi:peptide methionine sulfoxide reductase msrA/msrB
MEGVMRLREIIKNLLLIFFGFVIITALFAAEKEKKGDNKMKKYNVDKTEEQWKQELPPNKYRILRESGTERPFTGIYNDIFDKGEYRCFACGALLFKSDTKFDHGCGWPSFSESAVDGAIEYLPDHSHGMVRTEIKCANCGSHLGHVFDDGPKPKGTRYCVNSESLQFIPKSEEKTMNKSENPVAIFAAGCFWGVEYKFSKQKGVISTDVGYTGGTVINPTYQLVCTGATQHAEAVKVEYDQKLTDYESLVRFFFEIHDPTQVNRQGPDTGTQYRTAIFYTTEEQKNIAEKVKKELQSKFDKPIATSIVPASKFFMAEEYHQEYVKKKGGESCGM